MVSKCKINVLFFIFKMIYSAESDLVFHLIWGEEVTVDDN